jgi:hypothetical protein
MFLIEYSNLKNKNIICKIFAAVFLNFAALFFVCFPNAIKYVKNKNTLKIKTRQIKTLCVNLSF